MSMSRPGGDAEVIGRRVESLGEPYHPPMAIEAAPVLIAIREDLARLEAAGALGPPFGRPGDGCAVPADRGGSEASANLPRLGTTGAPRQQHLAPLATDTTRRFAGLSLD